jgi:hypothetical protein
MLARLVAAALIVVCALASPAGAQDRGWGNGGDRGHRGYRGRGRGWGYSRPADPFGSILGGIIGGWLGQQMTPTPPPQPYRDEDDERDSREGR